MQGEKSKAIELLRQLGLNQLEAEVYAFLLPNEPMTAYAIGTALGKPTANVYKAIEHLARLGAGRRRTSAASWSSSMARGHVPSGWASTKSVIVTAVSASAWTTRGASPASAAVRKQAWWRAGSLKASTRITTRSRYDCPPTTAR